MTKTQQRLAGVHIISLIGQQGSGKSSIGKLLATKLHAQFIEASDVVRKICGDRARAEMWQTNIRTSYEPDWLGSGITDEVSDQLVVLSGVREEENHDYFLEHGAVLSVIALYAPTNERYGRLLKLGKVREYKDFVAAGQGEMKIGLAKLLEDPDLLMIANDSSRSLQEALKEICDLPLLHLLLT